MAIKSIDYDDKESLQNDENIANKNKVTDSDMNQIKDVVNNNAKELATAQSNITDLDGRTTNNEGNTTALGSRVSTLETDNTKNKSDIEEIKSKNTEQDNKLDNLSANKVDKVDGKGLSTNDFTNEDKSKLDSLENYNDSKIKQDISEIQQEQETQNKNIESIQKADEKQDELIQKLKDNSINITTEEATQLHIEDASTLPAKLSVRGNHSQKVTETAENIFNGKLESGAWDYDSGQKTDSPTQMRSVDYIDVSGQTQISIVKKDGGIFTCGIRYYDADKNYIGRSSIGNPTDAITTTIVNNLDDSKTVKYATLTFTHSTDISEIYAVNKGADLSWHDFIPNSPSLAYPSEVRAVGDNVNILPNEATSKSANGIDWTVNEDGSIKAIGTATYNEGLYLKGNTSATEEVFRFKANKRYRNVGNVDIFYRKTNGNYRRILKEEVFSFEEDEIIGLFYLQIEQGETVDETYYPKIVEYREEMDESYSQYNQGSVEIKKLNSNIMPILNLGTNLEYTENGIKNLKQNTGTDISTIKVKKGQTIKFRLQLFSKPNKSTTFTCLINNEENVDMNFARFDQYFNLNQIYERSYTAVEDVTIIYRLYGNSNNETFEFQLWANLNETEDYQRYQEASYILPIQQPMLLGDYFDLENNKEIHKWIERELTGTEKIILSDTVDGIAQFTFSQFYDGDYDTGNTNINAYSNCYKGVPYQNSWLKDNSISLVGGYAPRIMTSEYSTVEEFKQMLAERYASGNPVKIYYKLINPKKLELTEEQKAVLQQLSELDLFKGTNNIITVEDLALLQMSYIADTQTYIDKQIDNKLANINQQILELAGGN